MSATTDRLDQMATLTVPPPWPVETFYDMPGDMFQFLFGLTQAWPMLRDEIRTAEAQSIILTAENEQFHAEHTRLRIQINGLIEQVRILGENHANEVAALASQVHSLTAENEQLLTTSTNLPERFAAAETVCASLGPAPSGHNPNLATGCYDGAAMDTWRRLAHG